MVVVSRETVNLCKVFLVHFTEYGKWSKIVIRTVGGIDLYDFGIYTVMFSYCIIILENCVFE